MEENTQTVYEKVKKAIKEKKYTEAKLGKEIGVSQQTISKYLLNIKVNILPRFGRIETVYMLFIKLGLDPFENIGRILEFQNKEKVNGTK